MTPLTVCLYEDEKWRQFFPLTVLRPVYTLRAGIVPLFKRVEWYFDAPSLALAARDQVAELLAESFEDIPVNIIKGGDGDILFLNGRIRRLGDLPRLVARSPISTVFISDGQVAAVLFKSDLLDGVPKIATQTEFQQLYDRHVQSFPPTPTSAVLHNYCWDIMADIESEITTDFEHLKPTLAASQAVRVHEGVQLLDKEDILIGSGAELLPTAVVDASAGPVYIGDNVRIEPHAVITGPCYIGPNSVVLAGKIAGSSIGHTCRVGGEVEHSVFHAYVNKYHAGFIGHSHVGRWVNFGAMTTNSDLKNNYSNVRATLNGVSIDTGSMKVGSFIGDHTKFGIGTLLTTGINIGVCCNIFGGTLVTDKEVPPFSWGSSQHYERYAFEKALETAQKAAERRNCVLPAGEVRLLQAVYNGALADDGIMRFEKE